MQAKTAGWGVGATPEEYGNPYKVPPEADLAFEPEKNVANWSETRYLSAYSPSSNAGIFFHAGRHMGDLDLWWAQTVAYLPNGQVVVDRSSGRAPGQKGMATGNLVLKIDEPLRRFSLQFDGAGEITTTAALAQRPGGSGGRYVPMRWDIQGVAVAPAYDMFAGSDGHKQQSFASCHIEQGFRTSGSITVAGKTYSLDGVGVNDHSCGARNFTNWGGHNFIEAVFPGMVLHMAELWNPEGKFIMFAGVLLTRAGVVKLKSINMPRLGDLLGAPHQFDVRFEKADGSELVLKAEVLHTAHNTVTEGNDNINGVEWEGSVNPYVATECVAKFTAPDGSVGYGHLERSSSRDRLTLPR